MRPPDPQLRQGAGEVSRVARHRVVELPRLVRTTEARHVQSNSPSELGDRGRERLPIPRRAGITVHEDHGFRDSERPPSSTGERMPFTRISCARSGAIPIADALT